MQACLSLSNLVSRDTCAASIVGNVTSPDIATLAIVGAVAFAAIFATLATRVFFD